VAAQLGQMRDENRKVWEELADEKRKVEKLVGVVGHLWEMVGKAFPGHCEFEFFGGWLLRVFFFAMSSGWRQGLCV